MKTITAIAGLVLLSLSAHAQDLDRPQLRLKPLNKKLELNYMGKDSYANKLNQLEKPGSRYHLFPISPAKSADTAAATALKSSMPVMAPDSAIQFHILALKPDSTMAYPMPIRKP